jgi:hypothetical protein
MVAEGSEAVLDPLAVSLLSIFGAVTITFIGTLIGAGIQGRREHWKWIRERRFDAYSQAYGLLEQIRHFGKDLHEDFSAESLQLPDQITPEQLEKAKTSVEKEVREAYSPQGDFRRLVELRELQVATSSLLVLVGPPPVALALDRASADLAAEDEDAYGQARANLGVEMRKALGVKS